MTMIEETFTKVVRHVFTNWTALKLAVDHSMGGPDSKQTALEFMNYTVQFCIIPENRVDVDSIEELLEDVLDQEFETICEDGSPKEIAHVLYTFLKLLQEGKFEECEEKYQKLPIMSGEWLNETKQVQRNAQAESSSEEEQETVPMEEDGWTQVKSRRKK